LDLQSLAGEYFGIVVVNDFEDKELLSNETRLQAFSSAGLYFFLAGLCVFQVLLPHLLHENLSPAL